jgi:ubiquinone/menaquinone biosynthesis C-methylase UbiE
MEMRGPEKWLLSSPVWAAFTSRVVVSRLWARTALPDRAEVLQLGCGAGGETEGLARRFPYWRITATDYDPDMVGRARQRLAFLGERVRVEQADATQLPYPDAAFDLAVAVHVWHHVGDWRVATAEAHRVLRPGGALLLADFVGPRWLARRFPRLAPQGTYTLAQVREALSGCGFTLDLRSGDLRSGRGGMWYRALARR